MSISPIQRLPSPQFAWVKADGTPTDEVYQYFRQLDAAMRLVIGQTASVAFTDLPTGSAGDVAYISDGRKAGETAGNGTGVLAFHDGTNWIAVDTGAAADD